MFFCILGYYLTCKNKPVENKRITVNNAHSVVVSFNLNIVYRFNAYVANVNYFIFKFKKVPVRSAKTVRQKINIMKGEDHTVRYKSWVLFVEQFWTPAHHHKASPWKSDKSNQWQHDKDIIYCIHCLWNVFWNISVGHSSKMFKRTLKSNMPIMCAK